MDPPSWRLSRLASPPQLPSTFKVRHSSRIVCRVGKWTRREAVVFMRRRELSEETGPYACQSMTEVVWERYANILSIEGDGVDVDRWCPFEICRAGHSDVQLKSTYRLESFEILAVNLAKHGFVSKASCLGRMIHRIALCRKRQV